MISTPRTAACIAAIAVPTVLALFISRAFAEGDYFSPTDEHLRLSLGAMHVSSKTTLRADSTDGLQGTLIDGEKTFGLDKSDFEPKFQALVRVADRQRLSFDYFTLDRTGSKVLAGAPIQFRDAALLPSDPLQTRLSLRTFGVTYEYSVWHSQTLEVAATLGVHETDISAGVKVQTDTRHVIQTKDEAGAVPTIGIDATWVASKRFYLDARAQYLGVNVNGVGGKLGLYNFDVIYRYRENVAFGLGFTEVKARVSAVTGSKAGLFDFSSEGPEMFFRIGF